MCRCVRWAKRLRLCCDDTWVSVWTMDLSIDANKFNSIWITVGYKYKVCSRSVSSTRRKKNLCIVRSFLFYRVLVFGMPRASRLFAIKYKLTHFVLIDSMGRGVYRIYKALLNLNKPIAVAILGGFMLDNKHRIAKVNS